MKSTSDTLVMIADFVLHPERRAEFLAYTTENLGLSRGAEGNLAFDILLDEADPARVTFYEEWTSAEAQQAYMAWRVERGDLEILTSFLATPPAFRAFRRVMA